MNTLFDSWKKIKISTAQVTSRLLRNPIARIVSNTYEFFYWYPRKNLPYDSPWMLFRNSTVEWIAWYQFPHNLPPYAYLGEGYPADFFCYGLPGNTLPLGNWDPCGFQLVSKTVVRKYRESELKHGRLAMVACVGFLVQEALHPLHSEIGGMAVTHMQQLREITLAENLLYRLLAGLIPIPADIQSMASVERVPVDYLVIVLAFMSLETFALRRNWSRWKRNEYNHQFDHNLGIGNLKESYENGNYGFDPLGFMPESEEDRKYMVESELNNGRLAMIAFIGMLVQEYFTAVPAISSLEDFFIGGGLDIDADSAGSWLPAF
eukprot:gene26500-35163_t